MEDNIFTDSRLPLIQEPVNFHSEEVQEIMGRRPGWILRWGVSIILLILVGAITLSWFIRYPQTVSSVITLTSENPPSDLVARTGGILDSVFVANSDTVAAGTLLALIASPADYSDVLMAESFLRQGNTSNDLGPVRRIPASWHDLRLGSLQADWTEYLSACSDYADYLSIDRIGKKKALIAGQVWRAKEYYRRLEVQRATLEEELGYELAALERDSLLLGRKAISQAEYEQTQKSFISKRNALAGFDATMESAHLSRLQLEQQSLELDIQRDGEIAEYERRLKGLRGSLVARIALWKEQYAVVAPYDGVVSLQNVWGSGQRVSTGDVIASIAPEGCQDVIGKLKVPSSGFGKVTTGQEVNIKLSGFPYLEFGILHGEVATISSVPENSPEGLMYTVTVSLPKGLESSYHKEFPFVQDMDGVAEIVTEDMRLLEQFIRPIRALFVN